MSIDSLYEGMIAKLTQQDKIIELSKKLLSLNTNEERVLFVYDVICENNAFPKVPEVHKSDSVSNHYRNHGNKYFNKSDDYRAWQYYNLALMYAPLKSEQYILALANRSAVFFSMKKFKECKNDIQLIFTMKYPGRLKDKLLKREALCDEEIIVDPFDSSFTKEMDDFEDLEMFPIFLSMESKTDPRCPCASSKLQVVNSNEMGRHVVAKEDIKVGEVLVKEKPYTALLLKPQILFSCSSCLSRDLNLTPCDKCCFALYCSQRCKKKALKEYHKTECKLMPLLYRMEFTKLELLALRTTIKARTDHNDWASLFNTIQEAEAQNPEYRGHVQVNGQWIFDSKYYASIHTLESNIEKRSVSDIFQKCVTAAVFLKVLEDKTDFLKNDESEFENIRKCVAGTLLLHIMTCPTNMHGLSSNLETKAGNYVDEVSLASAPYAFHSLLNHSCCPNVVRSSKLGSRWMILSALRPIKKGEQLFDNYGSHHALEDRDSRQKTLKFQYKFDCRCEACCNNWPTYLALRPRMNLPAHIKLCKESLISPEVIEKLQKADFDTAFNLFKPLCELAEALEPYAPCIELADCQESLKQCLVIFEGVVPYGYSQLVEWKALPPKV